MQQKLLSVMQWSNCLPCTDLLEYVRRYSVQQFVLTCNKFVSV